MSKAKKLPSGNWRIQIFLGKSPDGKNIMKSITAPTKKEAEYLAMQYKHEYSNNNMQIDCTVAEALDKYISNREKVMSPSTFREYNRSRQRDYTSIEEYKVSAISSEIIQRFINNYSINHSPKSTRNIYGLLHSAIIAIDPNRTIRVQLPQKEVNHYHIPTDDEIKILIDAARPELRIAILLASIGTMRRGEICGLKYSDIKDNFIHVQRVVVQNYNKDWVIKDIPKTNSSDRWIEYPSEVIKEIKNIGTGEGFIFKMNPNNITNRFARLKRKCGIDCRFHDLRHYAASIMHAIGVPDQYIMERGGWSSDVTLKNVYRNVLDDKRNQFVDKTNEYMKKFL